MANYNWTTEKGAKVAIQIEEITITDTCYNDGYTTEFPITEKRITEFTMNGQKFDGKLGKINCQDAVEFTFSGKKAAVFIPANIRQQIWAKEIARQAASIEADRKHQEHQARIYRAMNP